MVLLGDKFWVINLLIGIVNDLRIKNGLKFFAIEWGNKLPQYKS